MECCICGSKIPTIGGWTQGNNALPVADGRCCNDCNAEYVIPARLQELTSRFEEKKT